MTADDAEDAAGDADSTDGRPSGGDLPLVEPPFGGDEPDDGTDPDDGESPRVGGVLLAGGTSSRYGDRNKLLEPVDGEPIVARAARTLVDAGLDPVVAVTGHEAGRVRAALSDSPVTTVHNPDYRDGQASSVRTGVAALRERAAVDAAVVALGDMPFVDPGTVRTLVAAYAAGVGDALAAAHDGERGNPVLFDRRFFDDLTDVAGDTGGRAILLGSDAGALVAVADPGVRRDVDEPDDLDDGR
ncbi:nucleotidyltransferase family protein [Halostella salina]|uniref:nucleotidyltransferase family protein n=1 Tax=Halostella salina TaxID=1547897 RepID=UPI000EF75FA8|nr:nucleotidyltransferase family protein [Halostella salina]